jgi:iron complex outermembrane receptor protein
VKHAHRVIDRVRRSTTGAALTYEYDLNESWTLKSITAYRSLDLSVIYDSDGTNTQRYLDAIPQFIPASIAIIRDTGSLQVIEADQYSQELQLSFSNADIDWLLGLYAFRENSDHELVIELLVHSPSPILSTDTTSSNKATSYAAFTHVTYAINDRWELSGGLRYSYEKKAMERAVFSGGALTEEDLDDRWSDPTGEISLSVRLTEDVLGYLSFAQGFKSGGYSSLTRGSPSFAPEYVDAYEVGLKSEFLDRRVRLNLAAFRMDYEDLQVRFPGDVGQLIIQNATEATIDGAELELTALVSDFLTLSLAGAWLDATYGDYSFGGADFSGNRLNQAPEYSFSAVVDYGRQLPQLGELNASLSYYWQDEEFYRAENDDLNGNSGYEVLDGRISLSLDAVSGLSVALWGKNLTNDRYVGAVVPLVADRLYYASINRGRTYGLDVVYEF